MRNTEIERSKNLDDKNSKNNKNRKQQSENLEKRWYKNSGYLINGKRAKIWGVKKENLEKRKHQF